MSGSGSPIDPDIRRAETLDVRVYDAPELFARAQERVFAPSWQLVPPDVVAEVPERGARAFNLLPGALDEPLLLTADGGERRILSNVCTHRGAPLLEHPTERGVLVCPYHGRSFRLDGSLHRCPGFEDAQDFPRPNEDLARLPLETAGPLAFTSLDPAVPFDDWAGPLRTLLTEYEGEELRFDPSRSRDYTVEASWALYCENYLEGFHVATVHPGLARALERERYRTELEPHAVRQLGYDVSSDAPLRRGASDGLVADYLWLYPNLMVNAYAFGLSVNLVEPDGPSRCRVRYFTFVARPEFLGQGAGGDLDTVEREDQAIVESVARGVRSRLYPGGRFSPRHETGPHHFHRMLGRDLFGENGG